MIEFFPPFLEHFCPFFMLFTLMGSLFAQMGSLFVKNPTPLFFTLPSPLAGITTTPKHPFSCIHPTRPTLQPCPCSPPFPPLHCSCSSRELAAAISSPSGAWHAVSCPTVIKLPPPLPAHLYSAPSLFAQIHTFLPIMSNHDAAHILIELLIISLLEVLLLNVIFSWYTCQASDGCKSQLLASSEPQWQCAAHNRCCWKVVLRWWDLPRTLFALVRVSQLAHLSNSVPFSKLKEGAHVRVIQDLCNCSARLTIRATACRQ